MIQRVQATINLDALLANFQLAKALSKHSKMAAVIKANAYGHGLIPVAKKLSNAADLYAVTDIAEALQLHEADINKPILILQSIINAEFLALSSTNNFHLVIHSLAQLALLDVEISKLNLKQPLTIWLKLESGMGRLGISIDKFNQAFQALSNKAYCKEVIMMTHLANSSLPDSSLTPLQLDAFHSTHATLTALNQQDTIKTSIPASSGILNNSDTQSHWARPGLMLYGSSPFDYAQKNLRRAPLGLQAVMQLQAHIISIQHFNAGANVGYCSQFICPRDMSVAIVSIGYADGYPSNTPNGTPVLVNGKRCNTVGRVSMDMLAIDLSQCPSAKVGDQVILWGDTLSVDEIAAHTGIISYNLTAGISSRVTMHYG